MAKQVPPKTEEYVAMLKAGRRRRARDDPLAGLTKPAIRRLSRRAGIRRISSVLYAGVREIVAADTAAIVADAMCFMAAARRATIGYADVKAAAAHRGLVLY
jgi:histone H4